MNRHEHHGESRKRSGFVPPKWASVDSLIQKQASNTRPAADNALWPTGAPRYWSTNDFRGSDHVAYYGEGVCQSFMAMSPRVDRRYNFQAILSSRQFGLIKINRVFATGHKIVRDHSDIAQSNDECFYLNMQVSGRGIYTQAGERQLLQTGCVTLIDSTDSLTIEHQDGKPYDVISVMVPKSLFGSGLPQAHMCVNKTLNAETPLGTVLSHHLMALVDHLPALDETETASLLSGLTELLRQTCQSAVKPVIHTAFKSQSKTLIDIQCYVSAHLRDPDLSIDDVSRVFGLSSRYIYVLFARAGLTFRGWLTEQRLGLALGEIRASAIRGASISAVAYECGFSDLSHFNRLFKAKFGCTPRQVKVGGGRGD